MLNLTPHPITLRTPQGDITFAPSGTVARVSTTDVQIDTLHGLPARSISLGEIRVMYALINTMCATGDSAGMILSMHRTEEAAEAADAALQRAIKRRNGQSSYLPTVIVKVRGGRKHAFISNFDIIEA